MSKKKEDTEKESKEETEPEEEISEEEIEEPEIQELEFSSFIRPSIEASAPVLERIADAPGTPDIDISEESFGVSTPTDTEKRAGSDYVVMNEPDYGDTEVKYQPMEPPVLKPTRTSRGIPELGFLDPMAGTGIESQDTELPKIGSGFVEEGRRLPFEVEEKKYKEFKPRRFE